MREAVTRRKAKARVWLACWAALLACLSLGSVAQEAGEETERERLPPFPVTWKGEELPEYSVVQAFFRILEWKMRSQDVAYKDLLEKLGVPFGSEAEAILKRATDEIVAISRINPFDRSLEGDAFVRGQQKAQKAKAGDIGRLYGTLLQRLQESAVDVERFQVALSEKTRPSISTVGTEDDGMAFLMALDDEFSSKVVENFADYQKRQGSHQ